AVRPHAQASSRRNTGACTPWEILELVRTGDTLQGLAGRRPVFMPSGLPASAGTARGGGFKGGSPERPAPLGACRARWPTTAIAHKMPSIFSSGGEQQGAEGEAVGAI